MLLATWGWLLGLAAYLDVRAGPGVCGAWLLAAWLLGLSDARAEPGYLGAHAGSGAAGYLGEGAGSWCCWILGLTTWMPVRGMLLRVSWGGVWCCWFFGCPQSLLLLLVVTVCGAW